jgi:hypothetical protein
MNPDQKIHEKIRKLLALATSSNESEAAEAHKKAHALLREYNLAMEDIKEKPEVAGFNVAKSSREYRWKTILLNTIAEANYCELLIVRQCGESAYRLFGREHNARAAFVMYEYLVEAVNRITEAERREWVINSNEFRLGAAMAIADKIHRSMVKEATISTALVPLSTESKAALRAECANPTIRATKVPKGDDVSRGYMAGREVGIDPQVSGSGRPIAALAQGIA